MKTVQTRVLLCAIAAGTLATGINDALHTELDWPKSVGSFHIGGVDNGIAAAALLIFAFTLSNRCRLVATAALISTCVTEAVAALVSHVSWSSRVEHLAGCVTITAFALLLNSNLRKVTGNGH